MRNILLLCTIISLSSFSAFAGDKVQYDGKDFSTQEEVDAYKLKQELEKGITSEDGSILRIIDQKWIVTTKESALGDRNLVIVTLQPEFKEEGRMSIRCKDNETDLIFDVGEYMGTDITSFEYKVGASKIIKERTSPSANGKTFFVRNPIQFLK